MNSLIAIRKRRGFTLVELLVVMGVIGIIASMMLVALQSSQESAREAKTRATIAKLDSLIRSRYESYRTRRVPLNFNTVNQTPIAIARARLNAIRELMRMEMPDRWTDVVDDPVSGITRTSLSISYLRYYQADNSLVPPIPQASKENEHAECLYLIITKGLADDMGGREMFHASQIGDTDKDFRPEFLDGWGRPIRFLRWAPGFPSELQGEQMKIKGSGGSTSFTAGPAALTTDDAYSGRVAVFLTGSAKGQSRKISNSTYSAGSCNFTLLSDATQQPLNGVPSTDDPVGIGYPDPFDPRGLEPGAFALYPLIYSAGVDGVPDIRGDVDSGNTLHYAAHQNSPYVAVTGLYIGAYGDTDGDNTTDGALDNIHNHLIGTR